MCRAHRTRRLRARLKAEGKTAVENEKEKSEGRNVEVSKKLIEDDTIKDTEEEPKSLQGEPEAEC